MHHLLGSHRRQKKLTDWLIVKCEGMGHAFWNFLYQTRGNMKEMCSSSWMPCCMCLLITIGNYGHKTGTRRDRSVLPFSNLLLLCWLTFLSLRVDHEWWEGGHEKNIRDMTLGIYIYKDKRVIITSSYHQGKDYNAKKHSAYPMHKIILNVIFFLCARFF